MAAGGSVPGHSPHGLELRRVLADAASHIEQIMDAAEAVANEIRDEARRTARAELERAREAAREELDRERDGIHEALGRLGGALSELEAAVGRASGAVNTLEARLGVPAAPAPPAPGPEPELAAVERDLGAFQHEPAPASEPESGAARLERAEAEPASPLTEQVALLRATQMVIAGEPRERIEHTLRSELGVEDPTAILDEILSRS